MDLQLHDVSIADASNMMNSVHVLLLFFLLIQKKMKEINNVSTEYMESFLNYV